MPATVIHAFRNTSGAPPGTWRSAPPAEMVELVRGLGTATPGQFEAVHEQHHSHFAHQSPHFPQP